MAWNWQDWKPEEPPGMALELHKFLNGGSLMLQERPPPLSKRTTKSTGVFQAPMLHRDSFREMSWFPLVQGKRQAAGGRAGVIVLPQQSQSQSRKAQAQLETQAATANDARHPPPPLQSRGGNGNAATAFTLFLWGTIKNQCVSVQFLGRGVVRELRCKEMEMDEVGG